MSSEVITEGRSRRAILAALGGGLAALVAQAIGRPLPAAGANGDIVNVGDAETGTTETSITVTGTATAFRGQSAEGYGLHGISQGGAEITKGTGVVGISGDATEVAADTQQTGIYGYSNTSEGLSTGVWGDSNIGTGVFATSGTAGLVASGYFGAAAFGDDPDGIGLFASGPTGIVATTGDPPPAPPINTALFAYAPWPKVAGRFEGRFVLSAPRSGKVNVPAGSSSVVKTGVGLGPSSLVFAVVISNRAGFWVTRVVPVPTTSAFTVFLNATVPSGTSSVVVAYFVVN